MSRFGTVSSPNAVQTEYMHVCIVICVFVTFVYKTGKYSVLRHSFVVTQTSSTSLIVRGAHTAQWPCSHIRFYQNSINNTCVRARISMLNPPTHRLCATPKTLSKVACCCFLDDTVCMRNIVHVRHITRVTRFYCRYRDFASFARYP